MANNNIKIEVKGLDKLLANLNRFPTQIARYLGQAGQEASDRVVLPTKGLKSPPPGGPGAPQAQNWTERQRRYFFAALARGEIEVPYRRGQSPRSERAATQFYSQVAGLTTKIGNRSSYGWVLFGEKQSQYMAARGWKKLFETAKEKVPQIKRVYEAWIRKAIKDLNL